MGTKVCLKPLDCHDDTDVLVDLHVNILRVTVKGKRLVREILVMIRVSL